MTSAYPLAWPAGWKRTPAHQRETRSRFVTTFDRARRELLNEFRMLGAEAIVVSSWLPLRNDGQPRSDHARYRMDDPGVAVYFVLRGKKMAMARDAYASVHDNLRSIGLAIAHLRGLDRHGGATMIERAFEGFAALPAPEPSKRPWRVVLGGVVGGLTVAELNYRDMAKHAHPDLGGSVEKMAELNIAIADARKEFAAGAAS